MTTTNNAIANLNEAVKHLESLKSGVGSSHKGFISHIERHIHEALASLHLVHAKAAQAKTLENPFNTSALPGSGSTPAK
jgi:hypothetical protein